MVTLLQCQVMTICCQYLKPQYCILEQQRLRGMLRFMPVLHTRDLVETTHRAADGSNIRISPRKDACCAWSQSHQNSTVGFGAMVLVV